MKKNILLYILLLFLIVVNGFFLLNYLGESDSERPNGRPDNFIARALKFDDLQKQKFETLKTEHFNRIEKILDDEKMLKDDLFDRISNETIDKNQIDSITSQISDLVKARELETFYHFRAVQNICNDDQKEKFKQIIRQALRGKGRNGPGAPPPPNRRRDGDNLPPPRH